MNRSCPLALALSAFIGNTSSASEYLRFQHDGRAVAEAGAMVARSDEPSAVTYNPAAIARLKGLQIQAGLDFETAQDEFDSASGGASTRHVIQFPPALYATWRPPADRAPLAFGIGLDAPAWYFEDWSPALFPGRFLTRRMEVTLLELHPVVAYELGGTLSLGAGVRWIRGSFVEGDNAYVSVQGTGGPTSIEVARTADATVDGFGFDIGILAAAEHLSFGAAYRSRVDLDGRGDVGYRSFNVPEDPILQASLASVLGPASSLQEIQIPAELRIGLLVAPYDELSFELDVVLHQWSSTHPTRIAYAPDPFGSATRRGGWDDTVSLRLSVEGDLTERFTLYGGIAREPSPVSEGRLEPGFPRGDAWVAGIGFGWGVERISFDVGYSMHLHDEVTVSGQEVLAPSATGSYQAHNQVFAAGARWRF